MSCFSIFCISSDEEEKNMYKTKNVGNFRITKYCGTECLHDEE